MEFTVEAVEALAPDDASVKAARGLVAPAKWPTLGYDSSALWGECQGSGSKPYQTQIDLSGPSFKCSCPSRKFPCKHGLALMLLRVQHLTHFQQDAAQPGWVSEWLSSRQERAIKQEQKREEKAAVRTDPAAQAKREAARKKRMTAGLDELQLWLTDLLNQGLAQLPGRNELWSNMAARLVDAQLPGLAPRVLMIGEQLGQSTDWPAQVLGQLGKLQLLIDAWQQMEQLTTAEQADLRNALGWATDKDEVLDCGERLQDHWLVLGQSCAEEDRLLRRRTWLLGLQSRRIALLLDFAHAGRGFEQSYLTGTWLAGDLVFYPSAAPLRALWANLPNPGTAGPLILGDLQQALAQSAQNLARNPWQWTLPWLVQDCTPHKEKAEMVLVDPVGAALPLCLREADQWTLLALSAGKALPLMGEWDGQHFYPLSAWQLDPQLQLLWVGEVST